MNDEITEIILFDEDTDLQRYNPEGDNSLHRLYHARNYKQVELVQQDIDLRVDLVLEEAENNPYSELAPKFLYFLFLVLSIIGKSQRVEKAIQLQSRLKRLEHSKSIISDRMREFKKQTVVKNLAESHHFYSKNDIHSYIEEIHSIIEGKTFPFRIKEALEKSCPGWVYYCLEIHGGFTKENVENAKSLVNQYCAFLIENSSELIRKQNSSDNITNSSDNNIPTT